MPRCRAAAAARQLFTIHYSFFIRLQGADLEPCPVFGPLLFFSQRRRGAPRGGGEEEALVQTKMDPCFDKMSLYKVAIVCKFGTNLTCFSVPDRCRWPGAHRALQGSRAHQASGSGKRSRGHASLRQTAPGLPLCKKASYRSTVLAKFAPQPSSSPPPCTALLFFSAWRRRGGGCISDKTASQCLVAEKGKSE